MTPQEIIRAEYGRSRNIVTPDIITVGSLPGGAYELSSGFGLNNEEIFGVTVVYVTPDGGTRRGLEESKLFHRIYDAENHLKGLGKGEPT